MKAGRDKKSVRVEFVMSEQEAELIRDPQAGPVRCPGR